MKKDFVMPFGKFKGKLISEIPSGYLHWMAEHLENDKIATLADEEYNWRTDNSEHWYED